MADKIDSVRPMVLQVVAAIPRGKVATYGQVAAMAGMPQQSRMVGRILSQLPNGSKIPWQRVINSQGRITNPNPGRQAERLASEGVSLVSGRVDLKHYRWEP